MAYFYKQALISIYPYPYLAPCLPKCHLHSKTLPVWSIDSNKHLPLSPSIRSNLYNIGLSFIQHGQRDVRQEWQAQILAMDGWLVVDRDHNAYLACHQGFPYDALMLPSLWLLCGFMSSASRSNCTNNNNVCIFRYHLETENFGNMMKQQRE